MIAGIVIDAWKLPVFRQRLDAAGYLYTEHAGPAGTFILKVRCDSANDVLPIFCEAARECTESLQ